MFDISFSELLLIALVALVVLGPQRLPEVARGAGRLLGKVRGFVSNVKQDFDRELHTHELSELRRLKEDLEETKRSFEASSHRLLESVGQSEHSIQPSPASLPASEPSSTPRQRRPARRPKTRHGKTKKKKRQTRA